MTKNWTKSEIKKKWKNLRHKGKDAGMMNIKSLKNNLIVLIFVVIFAVLSSVTVQALEEELVEEKYASDTLSSQMEDRSNLIPTTHEDYDIYFSFDAQQGYDNNVELDSNRYKDGFFQGSANLEIGYKKIDKLNLKTGIDLFDVTYYKYNRNNLVDIYPYISSDIEVSENWIWKNQIGIDFFNYPNDKESSFTGTELSTALRNYLSETLYHEAEFEYFLRWYPDNKVTLHDARIGNDDREDARYKVSYVIGKHFEKFSVKLYNEGYFNESNTDFEDYYDYWIYRIKPSIMYFFTDKLYTNLSFTYKYTDYKDRRSSEDSEKHVRDNTYIVSSSFFYDITKEFSVGITYTYSENASDDPLQKYSGSVVSGGIYYSF